MHTGWHHSMFSTEHMSVETLDDMNMIVLPFFVHGMVLALVYLPIALFIETFFSSDIGWILMFGVAIHLAWYEVVHTMAHMKNPVMFKSLTRHHQEHHNHGLMKEYNFGIATTLCDWLFGTRYSA